jgi:hypothetical protein
MLLARGPQGLAADACGIEDAGTIGEGLERLERSLVRLP